MKFRFAGAIALVSVFSTQPVSAQEQIFSLEFNGNVSKVFYVRRSGSTEPNVVSAHYKGSPFTVNDGYCFLAGISHDMDKQQRENKRVYQGHRSPFFYHIGFHLETAAWAASAIGGAPGSWAAVRCVKF